MSDDADGWPEFVRQVEALANREEHGYRALLVVGMRVRDGVLVINGGASPPTLRQTSGEPLTLPQLRAWRNAMVESATAACDRVVEAIEQAQQCRQRGTLQ